MKGKQSFFLMPYERVMELLVLVFRYIQNGALDVNFLQLKDLRDRSGDRSMCTYLTVSAR